ncbi:MAG: tyrosine-type recombinase/integrase [Acidimicrobiales bacterium]
MTVLAAVGDLRGDLIDEYASWVMTLPIKSSVQRDRLWRGRRFLVAHPDLEAWMSRPTPARLADLHRMRAWPFATWLFVTGLIRPDLELVAAKPGGVDLPAVWAAAHPGDVERVTSSGVDMGWSKNWIHQVAVLALSLVAVVTGKTLDQLDDTDFDAVIAECDRAAGISASARFRLHTRIFALRHICFQLGVCDTTPRMAGPSARTAAEHAETICQPEIRREVVRYAQTITPVLRPMTVQMRIKSIRVLTDWLAEQHPTVSRLDQLTRTGQIEPFLAWARHRPWRGANGQGRTVSLTQYHHDVIDLRVFFEDIAEWGWASSPQRRLIFLADLPRLPQPLPRGLAPDTDRDIMAAVAGLDDPFARTGLTLLRATGMRIGELLDLELDCIADFGTHGIWLKVPLGKLGTERMVPLDAEPLHALDTWITARGTQRALQHARHRRPADFVFVERGRKLGGHRIRQGLRQAVLDAGVTAPDGTPLRVTPHQLRHTFGTALVNAGMGLPALMALLGHVTPDMTLRYAQVASPTVRAGYETAMSKVRAKRPLFVLPAGGATSVPSKIDWLHSEMLKTRVAHGFCSRELTAGACPYANICEQCDNYVPDPDRAEVITGQLDDIRTLRVDAEQRGWDSEAARHHRVEASLERHVTNLRRHPFS